MTTYEFIKRIKAEQPWIWTGCMILFERANTLNTYFKIYEKILELEPERSRGYRKRLLYNSLIISLIPPPNDWDESNINWVIKTMETPLLII